MAAEQRMMADEYLELPEQRWASLIDVSFSSSADLRSPLLPGFTLALDELFG